MADMVRAGLLSAAGLVASVLLDRLDAPLWLMIATVVVFVFVGLRYEACTRTPTRRVLFAVACLVYACVVVYVVRTATSEDVQVPIFVTKYQIAPLVENKPVQVAIFYQIDAPLLQIGLVYFLSMADEPPPGRRPNWLAVADQVWAQTIESEKGNKINPVEITSPRGERFFFVTGPVLTPERFRGLTKGTGALFIVGKIRYSGGKTSGTIGLCAISPDGINVALCPQHNGPIDK